MPQLATEQQEWADEHVDCPTTVSTVGTISGYQVRDDGQVEFLVTSEDGTTATFLARPPATAAELADKEAADKEAAAQAAKDAEAQAERDREAAAAAEEVARERIKNIVGEVLSEMASSQVAVAEAAPEK